MRIAALRRVWAWALAPALVACGGGGGDRTDDARLEALEISAGALSPAFDDDTTAYTAAVGLFGASVSVTPTARSGGASIEVDGSAVASGSPSEALPLAPNPVPTPVTVLVTSADGSATMTYTVVFTRAATASQQAYVKASNTDSGDVFGTDVAIDGDTLVVGAQGELSAATGVNGDQANDTVLQAGAAYVFVRVGATWVQQAYLKASNTGREDLFGSSVSVSGNTIVVSAPREDSNATGVNGNQTDESATDAGAAYVFVRNGGTWTQQAYLKASNTDPGDGFGSEVRISGDTIVVTAPGEASNATGVDGDQADDSLADAGAAYVFVRNGGTWTQQAYLKASSPDVDDLFGFAVAASGETIVVGAFQEDSVATGVGGDPADDTAGNAGAAYVFVRNGGAWTQQAYLKASNTDANDNFGIALDISGDTIVVGATGEDSNAVGVGGNQADDSAGNAGAAYVFVRNGGAWTQQAYLKASNAETGDTFGLALAIGGETIVAGVFREDSNAVGIGGNQADNSSAESGAAYVFVRSGASWSQQTYLKSSNSEAADRFGVDVAFDGDTVVAVANTEDSSAVGVGGDQADNSAASSGACYVFR